MEEGRARWGDRVEGNGRRGGGVIEVLVAGCFHGVSSMEEERREGAWEYRNERNWDGPE